MSSTFGVTVVEIPGFGKHPNADSLSISNIEGCPVIFRSEDFKVGDKAIYVPIESMVPVNHPAFRFLKDEKDGVDKKRKIKAKKLRGIFSMGLLVPAAMVGCEDEVLGTNVAEKLGITKYVEPEDIRFGGSQERDPGIIPRYNMESYRKYKSALVEGEEVVCTEKIHGCNSRFFWHHVPGQGGDLGAPETYQFYLGTHNTFKKVGDNNLWWNAVVKYDLENKLRSHPNMALYGEIYGPVQDLGYGSSNEIKFAAFDVYDISKGQMLDFDDFVKFCADIGVPTTPLLYRGPYYPECVEPLAEGVTTVPGANGLHIREGFVIRPTKERWDYACSRVVLKLVSESYLLRKNGTEHS